MADVETPFYQGTRLERDAVDLDALAQQNGYDSFAQMQALDPIGAQRLVNQTGGQGGTVYNQAAPHDDLNKKKMWGVIGGTVVGGALADYFAAGVGAGGAGASGGGASASGGAAAGTGAAEASPYVLGAGTTTAATTPSLGVAGTVGLPAGVGTAAQLGTPPPPAPPKPGSTLWGKIKPLLGLAGAGVDAYAAYKSGQATATATQQLVQAGEQAKADLKRVYGGVTPVLSQVVQRQQQNLAPYTSLGSGAASLLGYGLGIPNIASAPSGVYTPPADPFGTFPSLANDSSGPPPNSVLAPSFQQGQSPFVPAGPGQTPVVPFPSDTGAPPAAANLSSLDPRTQTASSYVRMRSPDGEVADVARNRVAFYQAQGAQVVQ